MATSFIIDIVKYKGATLPSGYGITRKDIEGALKQQGTEIKKGDIVLLRTGGVPMWYNNPSSRATYFNPQTGIVKDVLGWIKDKEIAAIAIDITECEKCQRLNISIIACITDASVIQKILTHLDKKHPILTQTSNLLPPMRAPPGDRSAQQDFDWGA